MSQAYSDPRRESDSYALPDLEVWCEDAYECQGCGVIYPQEFFDNTNDGCPDCQSTNVTLYRELAWWWWSCFPGCLPDSDVSGPFDTEEDALEDARYGLEFEEDE